MITAGAALMAASTTAIATGTMVGFATNFAVSFALGAALQALAPKPTISTASGSSSMGYQTNVVGSAQDHQIVYGKVRVGGVVVFDEATGNNNKFLHRIIAVAGHEIESFQNIYANDKILTIDSSGNVTSPSQYSGKMRVNLHLGEDDQTADSDLVSESNKWTNSHRLRGVAYLYVRFKFDADAYPNGIPVITTTIKGKKVYDPRIDTVAYSENPALCLRDYLRKPYGLDEEAANIDNDLVEAAADICDQTNTNSGAIRYTCNGSFTTASTPYDMLSEILKSMGGSLWYAQGKWRMKPAYWTDPVMDINEDDLRSGISVNTRHSRRDNFNIIKGTFRGTETNWQTTDYRQVTNNAFITADGGQESIADVNLMFTDTSNRARRLGLISLERNRQQLTVKASFGLRTLALQVGDNVRLTNTRFGWDNKEFEVVSWNFGLRDDLDLQVDMVLRETAESVFDEVSDGIVYERDNTELLSPFDVPSVGLNTASRTQAIREKLTNIITLTVSSGDSERVDYVEAEFRLSSATSEENPWITLGTGQLGDFEAIDLEDGDYDFRARAINTFAIKGDWEFAFNINASGLLEPPSDVTGFVAEVNGSVITLDWNAVPDLDLSYYRIRYSPSLSNATWANSLTYVDKVPRPASTTSVPARSGTYLVRAYDKSGSGSVNYTSVIVPPADIEPRANTLTLTDSTAFTGSKTNTEVVSSALRIDDYTIGPSEGEYLFSNYIETSDNSVKRCRVYVSALTIRHDNTAGNFDDQAGLFDSAFGNFDELGNSNQSSDTNIITLVSTTQDNPAGSPTWSTYTPIKVADLSARAFRFKVKLESISNNITPSVTALTAYVEYN
jgi:hypothetical protein